MTAAPGWCGPALADLAAAGLRRHPVTVDGPPGPEITVDGRRLVQLCTNDYLGLASDPRVCRAAAEAAERWGAGSASSRLVAGTSHLHGDLERALAAFKGCEDAIVFSSGYLAGTGTIAALVGGQDAVFSDQLNHASLIDGCRLSGARVVVYRHGDAGDLTRALAATPARRRLVVTDSIFSMDGDLAPLLAIAEACAAHDAMLMVDEAHAAGVLGAAGAGAVEAAGLTAQVGVAMGTLSKALGSAGGFVAGTTDLIEWLRNRARTYVFDTAPAPSAMGAALAALRIVREEPERRARVLASARLLAAGLRDLGYPVLPPAAAIVPVVVGDTDAAMDLSARLLDAGVLVPAIRPPTVPPGTARLRVTVTAAHTDGHIEAALAAFAAASRSGTRPAARSWRRPAARGGVRIPGILRAGGVFVTGTGTGVGKTVVAAALAATLVGRGCSVGVLKPVQTGAAAGADDLAFIRAAAALPPEVTLAPYIFAAPLAPGVCARLEGHPAEIAPILEAFHRLRACCEVVIVEGAGGLLVPLNDSRSMADLAGILGLPLLVVAGAGLGTLNHTALTVEAARARGLDVLGIALCRFPATPGRAEATNPAEIERLTTRPILAVVPDLAGLDVDLGAVPAAFQPAGWVGPDLGGTFDRTTFLNTLNELEPTRAYA